MDLKRGAHVGSQSKQHRTPDLRNAFHASTPNPTLPYPGRRPIQLASTHPAQASRSVCLMLCSQDSLDDVDPRLCSCTRLAALCLESNASPVPRSSTPGLPALTGHGQVTPQAAHDCRRQTRGSSSHSRPSSLTYPGFLAPFPMIGDGHALPDWDAHLQATGGSPGELEKPREAPRSSHRVATSSRPARARCEEVRTAE